MATFEVLVYSIKIEPHGNADALELAVVGDYRSIVRKGTMKDGDLVAYIPEASLVPHELLNEMGLAGMLSGPHKNRVRAIKLRGVMSQGLVYPARVGWVEGQDVTEELQIAKYEPRVPAQFAGEQGYLKPIHDETQSKGVLNLKFDIENIKKWNRVLEEGEDVVITEKIHGSFFAIGLVPEEYRNEDLLEGKFAVSSKGLISRGVFLKGGEVNQHNTYHKCARAHDLPRKLEAIQTYLGTKEPVWLLGEVFGSSVQGLLGYGHSGQNLGFRLFDIKVGNNYMDYEDVNQLCAKYQINGVPLLYVGPYSKEQLLALTSGKETITGKSVHMREGVVVKPTKERVDSKLGRVILKSVSDEYLGKSTGEEIQ